MTKVVKQVYIAKEETAGKINTIDISKVSSGYYTLKVIFNDGRIATEKIIKN